MAAIAYLLFAISTGAAPPDLTALAQFETREACETAAATISDALANTQDPRMMLCVSSDSLKALARENGMTGG